MKNLAVAYKSQWDADAGKTANDCGPASIAMILNYFGEKLTTNEVYEKTGAGSGLIGIAQMQKAIESFGYESERKLNQIPENLKSFIDQDIPVIALVHYGSLGDSVQDKSFKGGHFFTVIGYRDDGYFVNDPNFKSPLRADGDHHFFSKQDFERAWKDCVIDKNQPNSLLVIQRKRVPETLQIEKVYTEQEWQKERDERNKNWNLYQEQIVKTEKQTEELRSQLQTQEEKYSKLQQDFENYKKDHSSVPASEIKPEENEQDIPSPNTKVGKEIVQEKKKQENQSSTLLSRATVIELVIDILYRILPIERQK